MVNARVALALVLALVSAGGAAAQTCALQTLEAASNWPETMTVTNCHGCGLPTNAAATTTVTGSNSLQQGYNYPEPLGRQQQYLWFTSAAAVTIGMGCPAVTFAGTYSQFTERTTMYHTGYDGSRMELAAISENYVKIYVNNGGRAAMLYPTSLSSTIYYSLCTVASNGTETCPTYIALGTFYPTDNPFILITDLEDGEYNLKVYSKVASCTTCPTVTSDSSTPLQVPFLVITKPPVVSFTSSDMDYINLDHQTGTFQFASDIKSRWSGKNTDSKYSANGAAWEVFHSQFQVKAPWTSYGTNWQRVMADNDDGKGMYAYSLASAPQGSYTIELLNVLISNYSAPGTICGTIGCHSDCPSMCLSDFSSLSTYNGYYGAYSASPAARDFVFDSTPPKVSAGCRSGKCSGALYSKKSMEFEFSCTDTNAPCTFYCAIDGKPTTDPSAASSLGKGYKQCTSPVAVHAKASGSSTFTVYAVDAAGNVGDLSNPFTFYTDNTAPTVHFAGVAKRCLVDENYFIPDFTSTGPASTTANILSTANFVSTVGGICIPTTGTFGDTTVSATTPDTKITGTYGSTTCTCGTYQIYTDSTTSYLTYNQGTFPSLMDADSDSSLNAYLGYYPKSVPDKGLVAVSGKLTGKQYLVDGVTEIQDSDGSFDLSTGNGGSQSNGYMLYDVGTVTNTTDDISMTSYMYDTVIQVNLDITREVYNLEDGYYGAVLATKKVNDDYYYHVLHATNSPAAKVNMVCQHPEIKNCIQSSSNPFQMDCGLMIT